MPDRIGKLFSITRDPNQGAAYELWDRSGYVDKAKRFALYAPDGQMVGTFAHAMDGEREASFRLTENSQNRVDTRGNRH
jgi:hypothetical protein